MSQTTHQFFATSPRGLEDVLRQELTGLGASAVIPTQGGVSFKGEFQLCYRANLHSRIASRILWQVATHPYQTEEDIYKTVYALPWPEWFDVNRTIMVKVSAQHCPLNSLDFATLRIKDAVCDKFRELKGERPSVNTDDPDIRIHAFLNDRQFTLYLDTSGIALFQRKLRKHSVEAPLRENLAAGILKLAGWQPGIPLLDPMCGSAKQLVPSPQPIYGSDLYGDALKAAQENLMAAGLQEVVQIKQVNVLEVSAPTPEGILVTNPPYGVRIGDLQELAELYPKLGDVLKQKFAGWRAYIFTGDLRLPKFIRLTPSRKTPLFNGALECRLYEFKVVAGSMRKVKSPEKP
jgi:putative N6-adenine-specific DNA methylase